MTARRTPGRDRDKMLRDALLISLDRVDGRFSRGQTNDEKKTPEELVIRWLTEEDEPPQS